MLEKILDMTKRIIPHGIFRAFQPAYHYVLALCAAVRYGFPSRRYLQRRVVRLLL